MRDKVLHIIKNVKEAYTHIRNDTTHEADVYENRNGIIGCGF